MNRRELILANSINCGLPSRFTQVDYIGKDGSNGVAIDTGVLATSDITIEGKVLLGATGVYPILSGRLVGSPTTGIMILITNKNLSVMSGTEATKIAKHDTANPSTFKLDNKQFVYNGEIISEQEPVSYDTGVAIRLFVSHQYYVGADDYKEDFGYGDITEKGIRFYWLKIYNKGILVRNYIPCVDQDGVACFYDLVARKPYYNYLDGTMLYGTEEN